MSVSSLFNIGISGLEAADQLLQITGNNVANAQTSDYCLETADLSTVPSGVVGQTGASGNGVTVTDITRAYNSFINAQVNSENSNVSYWNNYNTAITQIQDIFNEASSSGVSPSITTYFNDWQNVEQNPSEAAQRTTLISDANNLSTSLNTAATSLNGVSSQLLTSSQSLVSQINTYTSQIATLNGELAGNSGSLDLQDQRDALISKLNGVVKVSTFQDPSTGMCSVLVGGIPLVEGDASYSMSVSTDSSSSKMSFYVGIAPDAGTTSNPEGGAGDPNVTSLITGGELASNIYLRDTDIPSYMSQLNAFAVDLADTTNYYQQQGYGLDGSTGTNFFQSLSLQSKYTSVDSVNGVFTSPSDTFSTNGGTLSIKLGDNDTSPATVTIAQNSSLNDVVNDINNQAGSKVSASVVDAGPATEFTVNASNNTLTTEVGGVSKTITVPPSMYGTYTGANLANTINTLSAAAGAGIKVTYDNNENDFTINSSGASNVESAGTTMGDLIGFNFNSATPIGSGITGNVPQDYRISIQSNPAGNLGNVRIGVVSTSDAAGSGLNLLATSSTLSDGTPGAAGAVISSMNVADSSSLVSNAQYNIDYVNPYDITAGNNTIVFSDGVNTYTATIATGNYSGSGLATAVQNALDKATTAGGTQTSNTFGVDYDASSPDAFTIKNTSGASNVTIQWSGAGNSTLTPEQLGFDPTTASSNISANGGSVSGDSLASAFVINSTNDTVGFTDTTTGVSYTGTIADGAYTAAGLAQAMQNALNNPLPAGGAQSFTVGYNGTSNEFSIQNNSADSMNMFTEGSATPEQFGFTSSDTAVGAGDSLTAANVVNSPYQSDSSGTYWRVMESTTDGTTWTAVDPNTAFNSSDSSSLNQQQVNLTSDAAGLTRTLQFQGIKVQIDGSGISSATNPNGETFNVQLDPNAAEDMATTITDPNKVAASSDTWNIDSSNNSVVFSATVNGVNSGSITAVIPSGTYTNDPGNSDDISAALTTAIQTAYKTATGSTLPDTLSVAFNPNTKQFNIMMPSGGSSDAIDLQWSSNSASTASQIFGFSSDTTVAVGQSAASDNPASVEANAAQGLPGGNTNATTIAGLANGTMFAGTTPTDFYMSLVSNIGVDASSANTNQEYHTTLMSGLTQQQQQVSGVSMDTEASNLVIYQKSYEAAAELITVANQMLTTLMQMVNPNA